VSEVRVLVVDDHALFRDAMAAVVAETDGFVVVGSAATGEQSLTANTALRPDLVLMDVNMPGMTGIEAAARMTATADAPIIILLSTYAEPELDYQDCGAGAYISKAVFAPERLTEVWSALTHQRQR
jgi:CheY-like chemotaxis protein